MIWQDLCWNGNPLAFNLAHLSTGSNHNGDEDDGYCDVDDLDNACYDADNHACYEWWWCQLTFS